MCRFVSLRSSLGARHRFLTFHCFPNRETGPLFYQLDTHDHGTPPHRFSFLIFARSRRATERDRTRSRDRGTLSRLRCPGCTHIYFSNHRRNFVSLLCLSRRSVSRSLLSSLTGFSPLCRGFRYPFCTAAYVLVFSTHALARTERHVTTLSSLLSMLRQAN